MSATPLAADRQLLGAGRDRRRARRRRLPRPAPRGHRSRPAAGWCERPPRACSSTRRPRSSQTSRGSASASTPTATATSRSASRAGTAAAASPTRAAARPAAAWCASSPRSPSPTSASTVSGARPRRRLSGSRRRPLRRRRLRGRPRRARPRGGARHRRRRGAVVAHDEPARFASASGCCSRRARAPPGRPRADAVPPDRGDRHRGREGFLVTEAIRGEGATLHGRRRRALRRGARAARRGGPRDRRMLRETGATHVGLDMRGVDPAPFPNVVTRAARSGARPGDRARAGRSRLPLRDGRRRGRPRRPTTVPGLYAVGERRAPACTARTGWRRTR